MSVDPNKPLFEIEDLEDIEGEPISEDIFQVEPISEDPDDTEEIGQSAAPNATWGTPGYNANANTVAVAIIWTQCVRSFTTRDISVPSGWTNKALTPSGSGTAFIFSVRPPTNRRSCGRFTIARNSAISNANGRTGPSGVRRSSYITVDNRRPSISVSSRMVNERSTVRIQISNSRATSFSLSGCNWLTINSDSGLMTGTAPKQLQGSRTDRFTVKGTNSFGSTTDTFSITITNIDKPIPRAISDAPYNERNLVAITYSSTEAFSITSATLTKLSTGSTGTEDWLSITTETSIGGTISGTAPPVDETKTYKYRLTLTNNAGSNSEDFTITVNNIDPPTVSDISNVTYVEGAIVRINVITSGDTSRSISFRSSSPTGGSNFLRVFRNIINRRITLVGIAPPISAAIGSRTYNFRFTATNSNGSTSKNFSITVNNTSLPSLNVISNKSYSENQRGVSFYARGSNITAWEMCRISGAASWLSISSSTGQITGNAPSVTGAQGTKSTIYEVTARNNTIHSSTRRFTVTVNNTTVPTVGAIRSRTINERSRLTINPSGSDVKTWSLTKTSTAGSDWLSISSSTGQITGTAPSISRGTLAYTYRVIGRNNTSTAAARTFTIRVRNTTPRINSFDDFTINESTAVTGKTASGDAISSWGLSMTTAGTTWLSINSSTGAITGTSPTVTRGTNTYTFRIAATGLDGTTATENFTVTVTNRTLPVIGSIANRTVNEKADVCIQATVSPSANVVASWSLTLRSTSPSGLSNWLSFSSSDRRVTGDAPDVTTGSQTYNYRLTATNNAGSDTEDFSITVRNTTPKLNSISDFNANENTVINNPNITASGTNISAYSISGPNWLNINITTGQLTGTTPDITKGTETYDFTVTATNSPASTERDTEDFTVTVRNTTLPSIGSITNRTVNEKADVCIQATVSPSANVVASWSLTLRSTSPSGLSNWLSFSSSDRRVTGDAPDITTGSQTYNYRLTATNNAGSDTEDFSITVRNTTPKLNSISDFNANENTVINNPNITASGTNISAYSISGPNWLNINITTGQLTGTTPDITKGTETYDFTVTATNSPASTERDTEDFTVTVRNTTLPSIGSITNRTVNEKADVCIQATVSPSANVVASWSLTLRSTSPSGLSNWLSFSSSDRRVTGDAPDITTGSQTYNYRLTATNNAGSDTEDFSITVRNTTPKLNSISDFNANENTVINNPNITASGTNISAYSISMTTAGTRWLNINSTTGQLTGTTPDVTKGTETYTFRVTATNSPASTERDTEEFTVSVRNTTLPSISSISDQAVLENAFVSVVASATPSNDVVSSWSFAFVSARSSASVDGSWLTFNTGTRTASGTTPLISGSNKRYTYRITASNNAGSDSEEFTITVSDVIYTVTWDDEAYTASTNKISANIQFSDAVTRINKDAFAVVNASGTVQTGWTFDTPSANASANTDVAIAARAPANTNGSFKLRISANSVRFAGSSSNNGPSVATSSDSISVDNRPVIRVTTFPAPTGTQTGSTSIFSIGLSQVIPVSQLTTSDFSTSDTNATLNAVRPAITGQTSANVFRVIVNNPTNSSGTYNVTLAANSISAGTSYKAGPSSAATSTNVTYNTRSRVSVSSFTAPTGTQSGASSVFRLILSHSVPTSEVCTTDFTPAASTTISSVAGVSVISGSASQYDVTVTNPTSASGSYTIIFKANAVSAGTTYRAGPAASTTSTSVTYNTRPRVAATSFTAVSGTHSTASVNLTLSLNYSVPTGQVRTADFTAATNTSISSVTAINASGGNASQFRVTVTQPTNARGSYTIIFKANAIAAGTTYRAGPATNYTSESVTYDTRSQVSVSSFTAPSGTQRTASSVFRLTLSHSVPSSEVCTSDFTPAASTTISSVAEVNVSSGNASQYDVTVTNPTSNNGSYAIIFKANAIPNGTTYRAGPAANYTSTSVTYNTRGNGATWGSPSYYVSSNTLSANIQFSGAVTGISSSDFQVINQRNTNQTGWTFGTISSTAAANTNILISVTPPSNINSTFAFRIKQNSVRYGGSSTNNGPDSNTDSAFLTVDNRAQVGVTSFTAPTGTIRTANSTFRLTLDRDVATTEITTSDFTPAASTTISSVSPVGTGSVNNEYDVTVVNPTNASGSYFIKFKKNAIPATTTYKAGPTADFNSGSVTYNTRPFLVTWETPSFNTTTDKLSADISFSHAVTGLVSTDFEIVNGSGTVQSGWAFDTPSATAAADADISISALAPDNTNGSFGFRIKANSIRYAGSTTNNAPTTAVTSTVISVDNRSLTPNSYAYQDRIAIPTTPAVLASFNDMTATSSHFYFVRANPGGTDIARTDTCLGSINSSFISIPSDERASRITNDGTHLYVVIEDSTERRIEKYLISTGARVTGFNVIVPKDPYDAVAWNSTNNQLYVFNKVLYGQRNTRTLDYSRYNATGTLLGSHSLATGMHEGVVTATYDPESELFYFSGGGIRGYGAYKVLSNHQIELDSDPLIVTPSTFGGPGAITYNSNELKAPSSDGGTRYLIRLTRFTFTGSWTNVTFSGLAIRGTLVIKGGAISGFNKTDLEIINNSGSVQTGWVFNTVSPTIADRASTHVIATPPAQTNGTFKIRLKARSISRGTETNNRPYQNMDTIPIRVDNRPQLTVSSFTAPSGTRRGATSILNLQFDREIPTTELTSSDFTLPSGVTINTISVVGISDGTESEYNITVNNPTNSSGTYTISLDANSISGSTTYKGGPTDSVTSGTVTYDTTPSGITATWGTITIDSTDRSASSDLTFSEDPGMGFSAPVDIRIQKRSGTSPTFTWTTEPIIDWDVDIDGTQTVTVKPIKAIPAPSVTLGTYRFILVVGALGSGTGGEVSGNFTIGDDMAIPAPTIGGGTFCPGNNQIHFSVYWSGASESQLSSFTSSKIAVVGGGSGSIATLGTRCGSSYPVTVTGLPSASSGNVQIQIEEDAVGESLPVESQMVPYDTRTVLPVTFSVGNAYASRSSTDVTALTTPLDEATVYVEISTNSRDATGLTSSDFIVSNGCVGVLASLTTNRIWRLEVSIEDNTKGVLTVSIPSNVVTETNQPASNSFCYDRTGTARPPTFTIGSAYSMSTGGTALSGSITIATIYVAITTNSRDATGLTATDFIISNGCAGTLSVITAKRSWRLRVNVLDDAKGVITVALPSNVVNETNQPASNTYCFDRTTTAQDLVPSVTLTEGHFSKSDNEVYFTAYWTNATTTQLAEFDADDITISGATGATKHVLTRMGSSFPVVIRNLPANTNSNLQITIRAGAVGSSLLVTSACVSYDTRVVLPVTFSIGNAYASRGSSDVTALQTPLDEATVWVEVSTNSRDATGLTSSDFIVSNGCSGTLATLTANRIWRLEISIEDNTKGSLTISIPSNVVQEGNQPASNTLSFDRTITTPSVTFTIGDAYASVSATDTDDLTGTLTLSEVYIEIETDDKDANGLSASDFIVSGACSGSLSPLTALRKWRLQVNIPSDDKGQLTISLPTNVVTQGNQPVSKTFTFDRTTAVQELVPSATISSGGFCPTSNQVFFVVYWANATETQLNAEFDADDVSVNGATGSTVTVGTRTGNSFLITIDNLPANTNGNLTITIRASAVGSSLEVTSACVSYDTRTATGVGVPPGAIFTIPNTIETGATTNIEVNFGERIHGLANSDFTITGHTPTPIHNVLARDFEIGLTTGVTTAPSVSFAGSVMNAPSINSVTRSPRGPQTGASQLWVIRLSRVFGSIRSSDLVVTGGTLIGSPIFIDSLYTLQITNPTSSSGTLNIVLAKNSVTSVDDTTIGPQLPQNSGSWGFDTRVKPSFTIGNVYADTMTNVAEALPITAATVYVEIFTDAKDANALTSSDFIVSGACSGTLATLTANRIWRLEISIEENTKGTLTVALPANSVSEGNDPVSKSFAFDRLVTIEPVSFTIGEMYADSSTSTALSGTLTQITVWVEIEIDVDDNDATGLISSDFIISGGCSGTLTPITANRKWRLEISILQDTKGFLTVAIPSDVVDQGNPPVSKTFQFDLIDELTPVTFEIGDAYASMDASDVTALDLPLAVSEVYIEIETASDKDATGLTSSDFIVSGGCGGTLAELTTKRKWRLQVSIPSDVKGELTISIPTNVITESNQPVSKTFSFNRLITFTPVLFSVGNSYASRDDTDITALTIPLDQATVWVELSTNSRDATGLTSSDFIVSGGCAGTLAALTPNRIWRLEISIEENTKGILTVSIPSNVVIEGNQPASNSFRFDRTANIVTGIPPSAIFSIPNAIQTGAMTNIRANFGEKIYGLTNTDFTITGHDPIPSHNILAQDFEIELGTAIATAPTVTLNLTGTDLPTILSVTRSPRAEATGAVTLWVIRLSRPFRGLDNTEVHIGGVPIAQDPNFIDHLYTIQITNPTSSSGTLNIVLAKNSIMATDDNTTGPELPQNSGSWGFDTRVKPSFTIGNVYADITTNVAEALPITAATVHVEIFTDAKDATGLTASDFIVSGACSGTLATLTANRIWRLEISIEEDTKGILTVSIPSNVIIEGNQLVSKSFRFDRTADIATSIPPSAIFSIPNAIQTGVTTNIRANFGEKIYGLTNTDFTITGHDPIPSHNILAQDFEIELGTAIATAPTVTLNLTGADPPTILSVTRSPRAEATGAVTLWVIRLSRPFRGLDNTEVHIGGVPIAQDPNFIDHLYTIQITNPTSSSGTLNVVLAKNSVMTTDDNTTGPELPQNSGSWGFDTRVKPAFSIENAYASASVSDTTALTEPFDNATIYVHITTDDKDATGLTASDFIVSGGCIGTLVILTTNRIWRLQISIEEDTKGILTVSIPSNVIIEGNQLVSKSFRFDRTADTVTGIPPSAIFSIPNAIQTGAMTNIRANFGEKIYGLTNTDFSITGHDPIPSHNILAQDFEIELGTARATAPTVTLNLTGADPPTILSVTRSPRAEATGAVTLWVIRLSRPFRGLANTEVQIGGVAIAQDPNFIDHLYTIQITNPISSSGTLNVVLAKNSVMATDDNTTGPELPQNSGSWGFDTRVKPTFSIGDAYSDTMTMTPEVEPLNLATVHIAITTDNKDATGLTASDFIVGGACGGDLDVITPNRVWRLTVNLQDNTSGTFTVALPANSVLEGNDPIAKSFYFSRTTAALSLPYVVASQVPTDEQTGQTASFTITTYVNGVETNIDGLMPEDFIITSNEGVIIPTII